MKSASGPLIGRLAARKRRITPGPASNNNTRPPTTTAVAGPEAAGSGYGVPVPSRMTSVAGVGFVTTALGGTLLIATDNPRPNDKKIASAVSIRLRLLMFLMANASVATRE